MCSTKKWSTHRLFLHQLENLKFWVCHYKVKPISAKSSLLGQFGSTVPASACSQHQMYRSPHPRIYGHYLGESFEPKHNENKISVRGANSRCRTRTVHIFSSWPGAKGTSNVAFWQPAPPPLWSRSQPDPIWALSLLMCVLWSWNIWPSPSLKCQFF